MVIERRLGQQVKVYCYNWKTHYSIHGIVKHYLRFKSINAKCVTKLWLRCCMSSCALYLATILKMGACWAFSNQKINTVLVIIITRYLDWIVKRLSRKSSYMCTEMYLFYICNYKEDWSDVQLRINRLLLFSI